MTSRTARAPVTTRDLALDAVRGGAIVAMVIAHTVVYLRPTAPELVLRADSVLADLASPLFALVIGLTAVLTAPDRDAPRADRRRFQRRFAVKGLLLVPLGWLLTLAPSGVDIVLDPLGITVLCAVPLLFVADRVLIGVVVALAAVGPLLNEAARSLVAAYPGLRDFGVSAEILQWLVLGHNYRVTGLLPLLLAGIVLGRHVPKRRSRIALLLGISAALFVLAQLARPLGVPHAKLSGTHVDLVRDFGLAGTAYAAVLLFSVVAPPVARRVLAPFAVQGRMALSVYAGHVAVLMVLHIPVVAEWLGPRLGSPWLGWGIQGGLVVLCWLTCALWWRWLGVGPLERVVSGRGWRTSARIA